MTPENGHARKIDFRSQPIVDVSWVVHARRHDVALAARHRATVFSTSNMGLVGAYADRRNRCVARQVNGRGRFGRIRAVRGNRSGWIAVTATARKLHVHIAIHVALGRCKVPIRVDDSPVAT